MNVPKHVAIILDGNGRWAAARGLPRNAGHAKGADNIEPICRDAWDLGVKYVTIYAFSTENWNRPKSEVDALMKILDNYLKTCRKIAKKNNMRVRIIGDITRLNPKMQEKIKILEEESSSYTDLNLNIALNYGSRDELVRATKRITEDVKAGKVDLEKINEDLINSYLDTADIPDPDLMIRTSGEQRLSNYLLWQLAYSEFYFTDVPWPDFNREELEKAIEEYDKRNRRFGNV